MGGNYSKNFMKLMCGTAGAQAISLFTLPFLTRMYSVDDFGVQALYLSVVNILAIIVTGRYELAILLPKDDEDSFSLVILVEIIAAISCFCLEIVVLLGDWWIVEALKDDMLVSWLPFMALTIFVQINYNVWYVWLNRNRAYNVMSRLAVITSVFNFLAAFTYGYFTNAEGHGLLLNTFVGALICCSYMLFYCKKNNLYKRNINLRRIKEMMYRYQRFPRFLTLAGILERGSTQMPFLILNTIGGTYVTGLYSMVYKIMQVPVGLVGTAMGNVFVREASESWIKANNCWQIYWQTAKKLIVLGAVPFGAILLGGDCFIPLFLGDKWKGATSYIVWLFPMFYMMFISSPLSQVIIISEKTKMELLICSIRFLLVLISMMGAFWVIGTVDAAIKWFGIAFCVFYCWQFMLTAKWAKGKSYF